MLFKEFSEAGTVPDTQHLIVACVSAVPAVEWRGPAFLGGTPGPGELN